MSASDTTDFRRVQASYRNSCCGVTGARGPLGAQGYRGPQGYAGTNGVQGVDGANGTQGATGSQGLAGAQGSIGATGTQGATGSQGFQGSNGLAGAQGATGFQGATGSQGLQGPQGVAPATAAVNYSQTVANTSTTVTTGNTQVISTSITTRGGPVHVFVSGDANPLSAGAWCTLQLYRDSVAIGNVIQAESSATNENVPYALQFIDTPPAGTYAYALKVNAISGGNFTFGEVAGPVINATELQISPVPYASDFVNAGAFVTLDNIKATVTTSGNRGLSISTVSGTVDLYVEGSYTNTAGSSVIGARTASPVTYTTTPSTSMFSWSFVIAGDTSVYHFTDATNRRFYRITLIIQPSFLNNFISIERLK